MSSTVTLGYWPSTLDNIDWSSDNLIAVAGNENVTIVGPRFRRSEPTNIRWKSVSLPTSTFSQADAPLKDPLAWSSFSLGEELSERHTVASAWSPPGIGKHRRSVLAVLTSNHALSIWECVGQPDSREDWQRALVVNHVLKGHYASMQPVEKIKKVISSESKSRIRSFAWSPILRPKSVERLDRHTNWGDLLLAVSNDCGDVLVLRILSPYDILTPDRRTWDVSIVHSLRITPSLNSAPALSCLPSLKKQREAFVDQLSWSPSMPDCNNDPMSILALTCQSRLYHILVKTVFENTGLFMDFGDPLPSLDDGSHPSVSGPIRWAPKPTQTNALCLLVFCRGVLLCFSFSNIQDPKLDITRRCISNEWDEVSGATHNLKRHGLADW